MLENFTLEQITLLWIGQFFLIFCRIGAVVVLMPGIGEIYVSAQIRLLLALALSFLLLPLLAPILPTQLPNSPVGLFTLLTGEIIVGLFIGSIVRMLLSLIHFAGMVVAFQSSLASAILFDINQGAQGSVVGSFTTLLATTLLFTSDLHHIILKGLLTSYDIFTLGAALPVSDFAEMAIQTVSQGFVVGMQIAAPVVVITLLMYLAAGVMSRLMPNMQVFFIIVPAQVAVSFIIFMISLATAMLWYLDYYKESLRFFGG